MFTRSCKKILVLCAIIFSFSLVCCACQSKEQGPRSVAQKYFNAVKSGDIEGAIECFTPDFQQQYNALLSLGSMVGEYMGGADGSSLLNGLMSYTNQNAYKDCKFKADEVTFTDDEHASVHVTVEGAGECIPSETTVKAVKYDGKWYIAQ